MPISPDEFDLLTDAFASIRQVRAVESDTRKRQDAVDEIVRLLRARIGKLPVLDAGIATVVATALARVFGGDVRREAERIRVDEEGPPPWLVNLLDQPGAAASERPSKATREKAQ